MKLYHTWAEYSFPKANLTCNSGIYSSRDKAIKALESGLDMTDIDPEDWEIEEIEIE